eukprot:SAG31_NODE_3006_length_4794_cov_3.365495_6_plen_169_part_00
MSESDCLLRALLLPPPPPLVDSCLLQATRSGHGSTMQRHTRDDVHAAAQRLESGCDCSSCAGIARPWPSLATQRGADSSSIQVRNAESALLSKWAKQIQPPDVHRWSLQQQMDYLDADNEVANPGPKPDPTCKSLRSMLCQLQQNCIGWCITYRFVIPMNADKIGRVM